MNAPDRRLPPGMREQLELGFGSGGLATFAQRPLLTEPEQLDAWLPDAAIVGAPFDHTVSFRPGARFGPRAIRADAHEPGTYHLDLGIEIFEWLEVVDFGDAYCPVSRVGDSHDNIRQRVSQVATRGIVPIVLGGDHSISLPAITAVAQHHGFGRIGVVHFDAHADTADTVDGNLVSHGTPMRRLIESGAVNGRNFVQIGLRGYWPPAEVFDWMRDHQMRWHLMHDVWERGIAAVLDDAVSQALDGTDLLYLSVDIDVLDPSAAPGTGTPEPGGLSTADLLRAVRRIAKESTLVGLDVVEVAPAYDHAAITVNAAHRVVLEALAGMAWRKRRAASGTAQTPGRDSA